MKEVVLIKQGEMFLKGLNKKNFETILIKNIKEKLKDLKNLKFLKEQSTITIFPESQKDLNIVLKKIPFVFGIACFMKALILEKDFEKIKLSAKTYLKDTLKNCKTFKVYAKRADKKFCLSSLQICQKLGEFLLGEFNHLKVCLKNPEVVVYVEIRDNYSYLYCNKQQGAKGMPVKSAGHAMLLLSGGIDSPVAGWMMAKRGLQLSAIHFVSPPYTSERALEKVKSLTLKLEAFVGKIKLFVVNITAIEEHLKKNCKESFLTVVLRRIMIKMAQEIVFNENEKLNLKINSLITGESLAQVASQTVEAINCTNSCSKIPIFRPLIGMDKEEIVKIAKKIDTFAISILPYEDCCTIFTPKHPKTNTTLFQLQEVEKNLNLENLIKNPSFEVLSLNMS